MRLHKLVVAISALAGGIATVNSHALGLGDVKLHTALNQPLVAEIELMQVEDLTRSEILSNLASKSDFALAGVERPQVLNGLQFKTEVSPNGKGVIKITSKDPIQEPFLNFLVEVHWPNGRLLKEYTLLLDPPVASGLPATPVTMSEIPRTSQPTQALRPASHFEHLSPASATRSGRSLRPETSTLDRSSQAVQVSPPDYRVGNNDNLWDIARQVRPDQGVTVQQTMLAIQRKNPRSFIDRNINRLKRGEILRVPDRREITSLTVSEAVAGVSRQNREWQQWRSQVAQLDATRGGASVSPTQQTTVDGKLAIVSAEGAAGSGQDIGNSVDQDNAALQTELAMTREQLDKLSRENAELTSRLQDLDDQIVTLRRLVEMKDDQMAALQDRLQQQTREREEPTESGSVMPELPDNPLYWLPLGLIPLVGIGWLWVQRRRKMRAAAKASETRSRPRPKPRSRPATVNREARADVAPKSVASPSAEVAAKFDQALARAADEVEADIVDTDQQTEDPLGEADIYIAYGRLAEAEELLKQAIFNEPTRNDLKVKLLKVYSESGELNKFNQVLSELEATGDAEAIAQAAALQASFSDELTAPIDEDDIPDLDLDELEVADDDFKSPSSPEKTHNADSLDVDLDDLDFEFNPEDTLARDSQTAFSGQGVSSLEASLDEDFDFLSEGDEVATKLDLARAYIDMGDRDGAAAILQEVLEQGTDAQKQEARDLLAG